MRRISLGVFAVVVLCCSIWVLQGPAAWVHRSKAHLQLDPAPRHGGQMETGPAEGDPSVEARTGRPSVEPSGGNFQGTVRVVPAELRLSGGSSFEVQLYCLERDDYTRLELVGDQWTGLLSPGTYRPSRVRCGQHTLVCESDSAGLSGESPSLEILLVDLDSFQIQPFDVDSGVGLDDIALWSFSPLEEGDRVAVRRVSPPIAEGPEARAFWFASNSEPGRLAYTAEAPGYCPVAFERSAFQHPVRLPFHRASKLTVRPEPESSPVKPAAAPLVLSIARVEPDGPGDSPAMASTIIGKPVTFDDLPEGDYHVVARGPGSHGSGVVLARSVCHVGPGEVASIVLPIPVHWPAPASVSIFVSGDPAVPRLVADIELELERSTDKGWARAFQDDRPSWSELSSSAFSTQYDDLESGQYRITLNPYGVTSVADLSPGVTTNIVFDLSDMVVLPVDLVEEGEANRTVLLVWGYVDALDEVANQLSMFQRRSASIRCVARPIWLQAFGDRTSSQRTVVTRFAEAGARTTLTLKEDLTATLALRSASSTIPVPRSFWTKVQVHAQGHSGRLLQISCPERNRRLGLEGEGPQACFLMSAPGMYRVTYEDRTRAHRELVVELRARGTELTLDLDGYR